ncbi:npax-3 [Pristionchus pacificus]|uniref:Npax-3 n=1 Tax=Pristionchus pacificus TaxID=54126 RepID=A0A2A6CLV4_PRIPA|nr:npax-3 [Pristionchus pacificus]|eukprot:PDM79225.1 npax-3 [Pristionchus pacificus]
MATRMMTSPTTNTLTLLGPTKSVPMSLQMPLHLNCHAKSEPCSPSSLSVSPRCFISESIQCIDKIEQMSSEELETKFHAWLNLDSPSGSDSRKCSFSVTSPEEDNMSELLGDTVNGVHVKYDEDDDTETDLRRAKKKGTNLYGRPYCPGRPLSMKERLQIIEYHSSGMKVNAISKSLCISHGCVSKIITRYRLTGVLTPVSSPEHRKQRRRKGDSLSLAPGAPMAAPASAGPSTTLLSPLTPPAAGPASVPTATALPSPQPQLPLAAHPLLLQQQPPATVPAQLHFIDHSGAAAAAAAAAALPPSMMYTDPTGTTYSFLQPVASSQLHALPHNYPYYLYPTQ